MSDTIIKIGNLQIKYYSLFLLIGIGIGIILLIKDFIFNMAFWAIIFGFLGARIYYVIFNWSYYAMNPISIIKIWEGGLAIHGGLIAGLITIYVYTKKYQVNFVKIIDMIVPSLLIAQAIGRWGNFFNQEAHGGIVKRELLKKLKIPNFIIEGMNIMGVYYHPTFYYESLWCLLGFIIINIIKRFKGLKCGVLTCFYLIWYSLGRFIIESMRTDSLMLSGFKVAQIVSFILIIIAIVWLVIIFKKGKFEDLYHEDEGVK